LVLKFNKEKISKLLSEINNSLSSLYEISKLSKEDFLKDKFIVASSKYFLIIAIEAIIDICNHLISANKFRIPEDYKDSFRIMSEEKILDKDFASKLIEMAKFRNRLVHIYWEVDDEIIYEIIKTDIQDIENFTNKIVDIIQKTKDM